MEFEISDHETLPNWETKPVLRQLDRRYQPRQIADDTMPDPSDGLREPVFQLTQ